MNKEQKWISVKVVHPAISGVTGASRTVKCLTESGKTLQGKCYRGDGLRWINHRGGLVEEQITHWKPK